jgi:BirA family transcriptional regulator, biotin operon repressor / biotin---[acetyl-CoA-carboxylase] ligase
LYKIPANTLFLGKNLVFMPECHSTNTIAMELCQQSHTPEGTLVITSKQIAGRGQRGNTWESEPNSNLTLSLVLKPSFLAIKDQFYLNIFVSLAIRDLLSQMCSATVQIKWPNDILINELKICGILIENQLSGDRITNAVVGIGLNINQRHFASSTATSLALITSQAYELQLVLELLLGHLETYYLHLRQHHYEKLRAAYLKHLYRINEDHSFLSHERKFEGKIVGIDAHGRLRIRTDGEEKVFGIKEVAFA